MFSFVSKFVSKNQNPLAPNLLFEQFRIQSLQNFLDGGKDDATISGESGQSLPQRNKRTPSTLQ